MEIVVLIKYAPERMGPLEVEEQTLQIADSGVPYGLGTFDEMALEEALSLKAKFGGNVTAVTVGPEKEEEGLRYALAMGADQAIRIWDEKLPLYDPWTIANTLAQVLNRKKYDLILGGNLSADGGNGLVLNYLGTILGLPAVTGIVKITEYRAEANILSLHRHAGKGDRWVIECSAPAILGVEKSASDPRYPTMYGRLKAEKAQILLELGVSQGEDVLVELVNLTKARPKPKKIFTPDSNLSAADRMKMILSGGVSKKKAAAGGASDANSGAKQVMDVLKQTGILKTQK